METDYCAGNTLHLWQGNKIAKSLKHGGEALIRVKYNKNLWHYLLTLSVQDTASLKTNVCLLLNIHYNWLKNQ